MTNQERLKTDTVFVDTVIRECAMLTIQRETDRMKIEELEEQLANSETAPPVVVEDPVTKKELLAAKRDIVYLMAGGDPCKVCAKEVCKMGAPCQPVWKGGAEE